MLSVKYKLINWDIFSQAEAAVKQFNPEEIDCGFIYFIFLHCKYFLFYFSSFIYEYNFASRCTKPLL